MPRGLVFLSEQAWQLGDVAPYAPSLVQSEDVGDVGIGAGFAT